MSAGTKVKLSHDELEALVDKEARRRLNMTARQFRAKWERGALRKSAAAQELAMLLSLNGRKQR